MMTMQINVAVLFGLIAIAVLSGASFDPHGRHIFDVVREAMSESQQNAPAFLSP